MPSIIDLILGFGKPGNTVSSSELPLLHRVAVLCTLFLRFPTPALRFPCQPTETCSRTGPISCPILCPISFSYGFHLLKKSDAKSDSEVPSLQPSFQIPTWTQNPIANLMPTIWTLESRTQKSDPKSDTKSEPKSDTNQTPNRTPESRTQKSDPKSDTRSDPTTPCIHLSCTVSCSTSCVHL